MKVALTVAGSDSGGGAGIQADLKTFHRFGVFGTSAVTAITAQNTTGVLRWEALQPSLVKAQIDAVATDLRPRSVKSGMLANEGIVRAVAAALREHEMGPYVLDPVMVATSGDLLVHRGTAEAIRALLLPLAALVTPNSDEAAVLAGFPVRNSDDMHRAAETIFLLGAGAVLVKGGHIASERDESVVDVFYDGAFEVFTHPRIATTSTHGTGCTLSAAIAAQLACDTALRTSVRVAIDYVHSAIASAPGLGAGNGPLNHFAGGSLPTNAVTSA